jgi:pyruvate dehydrogenase E1 component alpha subunit
MAVADHVDTRSPVRRSPVSIAAGNGNGQPTGPERETALQRLRMMLLIRRFEERTYREYSQPRTLPDGTKEMKIGGFLHLYSGQEAIAVGTAALFDKSRDYLITGYRCHGASLALGMTPRAAMAELFGKATGCSKGKGGSMHLFQTDVGNLGGHGIVGAQLPLGLGTAFAQEYKKSGGVTFCFMGDGAINQGTFNEALNLASLYKVPCIYVVENNGVAMGTQVERHSAEKDLAKRACGYAMPARNIDGNDLDIVIQEFGEAVRRARAGEGPSFLVANTFRFRGHSMSDPLKYRTREEAERARQRDPLMLYARRLSEHGILPPDAYDAIRDEEWDNSQITREVAAEVEEGIQQAEADPHPPLEARFDDVLSERYPLEK